MAEEATEMLGDADDLLRRLEATPQFMGDASGVRVTRIAIPGKKNRRTATAVISMETDDEKTATLMSHEFAKRAELEVARASTFEKISSALDQVVVFLHDDDDEPDNKFIEFLQRAGCERMDQKARQVVGNYRQLRRGEVEERLVQWTRATAKMFVFMRDDRFTVVRLPCTWRSVLEFGTMRTEYAVRWVRKQMLSNSAFVPPRDSPGSVVVMGRHFKKDERIPRIPTANTAYRVLKTAGGLPGVQSGRLLTMSQDDEATAKAGMGTVRLVSRSADGPRQLVFDAQKPSAPATRSLGIVGGRGVSQKKQTESGATTLQTRLLRGAHVLSKKKDGHLDDLSQTVGTLRALARKIQRRQDRNDAVAARTLREYERTGSKPDSPEETAAAEATLETIEFELLAKPMAVALHENWAGEHRLGGQVGVPLTTLLVRLANLRVSRALERDVLHPRVLRMVKEREEGLVGDIGKRIPELKRVAAMKSARAKASLEYMTAVREFENLLGKLEDTSDAIEQTQQGIRTVRDAYYASSSMAEALRFAEEIRGVRKLEERVTRGVERWESDTIRERRDDEEREEEGEDVVLPFTRTNALSRAALALYSAFTAGENFSRKGAAGLRTMLDRMGSALGRAKKAEWASLTNALDDEYEESGVYGFVSGAARGTARGANAVWGFVRRRILTLDHTHFMGRAWSWVLRRTSAMWEAPLSGAKASARFSKRFLMRFASYASNTSHETRRGPVTSDEARRYLRTFAAMRAHLSGKNAVIRDATMAGHGASLPWKVYLLALRRSAGEALSLTEEQAVRSLRAISDAASKLEDLRSRRFSPDAPWRYWLLELVREMDGGGWYVNMTGRGEVGPFATRERAIDAVDDRLLLAVKGEEEYGRLVVPQNKEGEPVDIDDSTAVRFTIGRAGPGQRVIVLRRAPTAEVLRVRQDFDFSVALEDWDATERQKASPRGPVDGVPEHPVDAERSQDSESIKTVRNLLNLVASLSRTPAPQKGANAREFRGDLFARRISTILTCVVMLRNLHRTDVDVPDGDPVERLRYQRLRRYYTLQVLRNKLAPAFAGVFEGFGYILAHFAEKMARAMENRTGALAAVDTTEARQLYPGFDGIGETEGDLETTYTHSGFYQYARGVTIEQALREAVRGMQALARTLVVAVHRSCNVFGRMFTNVMQQTWWSVIKQQRGDEAATIRPQFERFMRGTTVLAEMLQRAVAAISEPRKERVQVSSVEFPAEIFTDDENITVFERAKVVLRELREDVNPWNFVVPDLSLWAEMASIASQIAHLNYDASHRAGFGSMQVNTVVTTYSEVTRASLQLELLQSLFREMGVTREEVQNEVQYRNMPDNRPWTMQFRIVTGLGRRAYDAYSQTIGERLHAKVKYAVGRLFEFGQMTVESSKKYRAALALMAEKVGLLENLEQRMAKLHAVARSTPLHAFSSLSLFFNALLFVARRSDAWFARVPLLATMMQRYRLALPSFRMKSPLVRVVGDLPPLHVALRGHVAEFASRLNGLQPDIATYAYNKALSVIAYAERARVEAKMREEELRKKARESGEDWTQAAIEIPAPPQLVALLERHATDYEDLDVARRLLEFAFDLSFTQGAPWEGAFPILSTDEGPLNAVVKFVGAVGLQVGLKRRLVADKTFERLVARSAARIYGGTPGLETDYVQELRAFVHSITTMYDHTRHPEHVLAHLIGLAYFMLLHVRQSAFKETLRHIGGVTSPQARRRRHRGRVSQGAVSRMSGGTLGIDTIAEYYSFGGRMRRLADAESDARGLYTVDPNTLGGGVFRVLEWLVELYINDEDKNKQHTGEVGPFAAAATDVHVQLLMHLYLTTRN